MAKRGRPGAPLHIRKECVERILQGERRADLATEYGVSYPTICNWFRQRDAFITEERFPNRRTLRPAVEAFVREVNQYNDFGNWKQEAVWEALRELAEPKQVAMVLLSQQVKRYKAFLKEAGGK